ncbi:DUF3592 domain-containing protein [Streptomyces phyllanthi]|uniref:DUF3592 domain-containing protein n=1 Tax=Streptomyces phyllanthi TaxID=1803180 RepID=A0A5N8WBV2_9ACTN|nr:DUF3592 domain-containing protein [Streptomyces phyllanthi]MPY44960.1 hypothetical protein [Streptomyces phyllanthi]
MDWVFHILFPLLIVLCLYGGYEIIRRDRQRRAAWSGLTAQARVTRAWVTTRIVNDVPQRIQNHQFDFTTADGRAVRFEEAGGSPDLGVGDEILVHYASDDPDAATAFEPGTGSTRTVLALLVLGAGLIVLVKVMIQYW